jgi:hypothetical protein
VKVGGTITPALTPPRILFTGLTALVDPYRRPRIQVMGKNLTTALYVLAMVAVVVGVDVLFFRHQFWPRLAANIGIVLVFAAFYFRFLKHP